MDRRVRNRQQGPVTETKGKGGFRRRRVVSHVSAVRKLKEMADQEKRFPALITSHDEEIIHLSFLTVDIGGSRLGHRLEDRNGAGEASFLGVPSSTGCCA